MQNLGQVNNLFKDNILTKLEGQGALEQVEPMDAVPGSVGEFSNIFMGMINGPKSDKSEDIASTLIDLNPFKGQKAASLPISKSLQKVEVPEQLAKGTAIEGELSSELIDLKAGKEILPSSDMIKADENAVVKMAARKEINGKADILPFKSAKLPENSNGRLITMPNQSMPENVHLIEKRQTEAVQDRRPFFIKGDVISTEPLLKTSQNPGIAQKSHLAVPLGNSSLGPVVENEYKSMFKIPAKEGISDEAEKVESGKDKDNLVFFKDLKPKKMAKGKFVAQKQLKEYIKEQGLFEDNLLKSTSVGQKAISSKGIPLKIKGNELFSSQKATDKFSGEGQLNETGTFEINKMPVVHPNKGTVGGGPFLNGRTIKALDLSTIDTTNSIELVNKISDYIQQNGMQRAQSLDMTIHHDSLGQFKINVGRPEANLNQLNLEIITSTDNGQEFFTKNEAQLIKTLINSGLKIADLRIVPTERQFAEFNDSKGPSSEYNHLGKEDSSSDLYDKSDQQDRDSRRRKELWEMYRERLGA